MARMVRKQIVIDAEREKTLARLAQELDVSQSEVVRQAIDGFAARVAGRGERERAWTRLMEVFESASEHGVTDAEGCLEWSRADLHDRRRPR